MPDHQPLHVEPRRVRAAFDVRDTRFDQLSLSDPETWRQVGTPLEERVLR